MKDSCKDINSIGSFSCIKFTIDHHTSKNMGSDLHIRILVLSFCLLRVDVVVFVIWELVIVAFFVFSGISLYLRQLRMCLVLASITLLLLLCMKVTKHVKLARKKKRRMLLPLSM